MESHVKDDMICEPVMERLAHLPAGFIHFVDDLGKDLQPLFGHGVRCPAAGVCGGVERCPAFYVLIQVIFDIFFMRI